MYLHLLNEQDRILEPGVYCDKHQCVRDVQLPSFSLGERNPLVDTVHKKTIQSWQLDRFSEEEMRTMFAENNEEITFLCLPLMDRQKTSMGVVVLIYKELSLEKKNEYLEERLVFVQQLSSLAGVTLETRYLIKKQKDLFDAFIKLIAGAIDAKSPYTGGHCQRVPVSLQNFWPRRPVSKQAALLLIFPLMKTSGRNCM